jgi:hypothetical protein
MVRSRLSGLTVIYFLLRFVILTVLTLGLYLLYFSRDVQLWRLCLLQIDGQRVRYVGTFRGWITGSLRDQLVMWLSAGIYAPWAVAADTGDARTLLRLTDGRRLRFKGRGGQIILLTLASIVLVPLTAGVATPWLLQQWKAWEWSQTWLSTPEGEWRQLGWQGSVNDLWCRIGISVFWSLITLGLFLPWGIAWVLRWEADGVVWADAA